MSYGTVFAISGSRGGTPTATLRSGAVLSFGTGTSAGSLQFGTSSSAISHTSESSKVIAGYVTTSSTSGSTSYEPWYFKTTLTGAGQVGGRLLSHTYANVAAGGWVNALKGYMEFGTSGKTTGLASAIVAEMKVANANLGSGGAYMPLEVELVYGGTSVVSAGALNGNHVAFATYRFSGDTDGDFDDNGYLMTVTGLTAGASHVLSAQSVTLRMGVGTTAKYLVMSSAENSLTIPDGVTTGVQIGNATTGILLDGDMTDAIKIAGSNTIVDGIEINACTNGVNIAGATTTGLLIAGASSSSSIALLAKAGTGFNVGSILIAGDQSGTALAYEAMLQAFVWKGLMRPLRLLVETTGWVNMPRIPQVVVLVLPGSLWEHTTR